MQGVVQSADQGLLTESGTATNNKAKPAKEFRRRCGSVSVGKDNFFKSGGCLAFDQHADGRHQICDAFVGVLPKLVEPFAFAVALF